MTNQTNALGWQCPTDGALMDCAKAGGGQPAGLLHGEHAGRGENGGRPTPLLPRLPLRRRLEVVVGPDRHFDTPVLLPPVAGLVAGDRL